MFKKIKEMCKNIPFGNALVSLAPVVRMDICSHLFLEYISHLNVFTIYAKADNFSFFIGFFVTREKFVKFSKSANLTPSTIGEAGRLPVHCPGMAWHGMACPSDRAWHGRALWQGPHQ